MRRIGFVLVLVGMLLAVACQPEIESHTVKILGLESLREVRIEHGNKYQLPPAPEKVGYIFEGITDVDGKTYAPGTDVVVTSNLTLTYNWKIKEYKVHIISGDEDIPDTTVEHGGTYTPEERTLAGHTFLDVTDGEGNPHEVGTPIAVTSDLTLTYNYEINSYSVEVYEEETLVSKTTYKYGETFTPERKTRSGYILQNITDGEGNSHEAEVSITVTSDLTLTYNWESAIYKIGDTGPAGGMIFYVDEGGKYPEWDYLETSTGDDGIGEYRFGYYYVDGVKRMVGTEDGVGVGRSNTEKLVEAMGDTAWDSEGNRNVSEYAAKMCADYSVTKDGIVYDDWFLPSKDELNLVYQNLREPGHFDSWSGCYWSSSEMIDSRYACDQDLTDGSTIIIHERKKSNYVLPVRAF